MITTEFYKMVKNMREGKPKANTTITLTIQGLNRVEAIKKFLSRDTSENWKISHIIEGLLFIFEKNMKVMVTSGNDVQEVQK